MLQFFDDQIERQAPAQPVGDAEHDALANGDQGHTGHGRADGRGHNAGNPAPAGGEDLLAEAVQLGSDIGAVAVDEEQRHDHEQHAEQEVQRTRANREDGAVDVADIGAAEGGDHFADGAGTTDVEVAPIARSRNQSPNSSGIVANQSGLVAPWRLAAMAHSDAGPAAYAHQVGGAAEAGGNDEEDDDANDHGGLA